MRRHPPSTAGHLGEGELTLLEEEGEISTAYSLPSLGSPTSLSIRDVCKLRHTHPRGGGTGLTFFTVNNIPMLKTLCVAKMFIAW